MLDFGIAKLLRRRRRLAPTRTGVQMGTPLYMSPEQWDGRGVDQRTDVYALGVLVHHALTGRYPFESTSRLALMNMHGTAPPVLPSGLGGPSWADGVVATALAKDRSQRFASAGALARALRAAYEAAAPAAAALTSAEALAATRALAPGPAAAAAMSAASSWIWRRPRRAGAPAG